MKRQNEVWDTRFTALLYYVTNKIVLLALGYELSVNLAGRQTRDISTRATCAFRPFSYFSTKSRQVAVNTRTSYIYNYCAKSLRDLTKGSVARVATLHSIIPTARARKGWRQHQETLLVMKKIDIFNIAKNDAFLSRQTSWDVCVACHGTQVIL